MLPALCAPVPWQEVVGVVHVTFWSQPGGIGYRTGCLRIPVRRTRLCCLTLQDYMCTLAANRCLKQCLRTLCGRPCAHRKCCVDRHAGAVAGSEQVLWVCCLAPRCCFAPGLLLQVLTTASNSKAWRCGVCGCRRTEQAGRGAGGGGGMCQQHATLPQAACGVQCCTHHLGWLRWMVQVVWWCVVVRCHWAAGRCSEHVRARAGTEAKLAGSPTPPCVLLCDPGMSAGVMIRAAAWRLDCPRLWVVLQRCPW